MSLLITFEGADGTGKSTAVKYAHQYLTEKSIAHTMTGEPSGTELGKLVRQLITSMSVTKETAMLLVSAARREHIQEVIQPALNRDHIVICDRFVDSTYAYQVCGFGGDETKCSILEDISCGSLMPDLTILTQCPYDVSSGRMFDRGKLDTIEKMPPDFHKRVVSGFEHRASTNPWPTVVLNTHFGPTVEQPESMERVRESVYRILDQFLNL